MTMDVTEQTFEVEVIERSAERPVVVDFWADWCGPCKVLAPVLEEAVAGRDVVLAKVDVDANKALADEYGIRGIPAVKAFRNGHVVAAFVGAQSRAAVQAFLDELAKPSVADSVEDPDVADALGAGDYERAFEILLARVHDTERREEVRRVMVELFGELGHEHPLTVRYRRRLATALY
jgi:putative thioredoxin